MKQALGLAIEGVGVEKVLTVIPLRPQGTPDITGVADSRAWLVSTRDYTALQRMLPLRISLIAVPLAE
jgi:hypothetical protein